MTIKTKHLHAMVRKYLARCPKTTLLGRIFLGVLGVENRILCDFILSNPDYFGCQQFETIPHRILEAINRID